MPSLSVLDIVGRREVRHHPSSRHLNFEWHFAGVRELKNKNKNKKQNILETTTVTIITMEQVSGHNS
jgi:hypothetical protein